MSNEIDEKLFKQISGHTLIKLADKLINTTDKEENQIIVENIEKNKDKLFKEDKFYHFVIQPSDRRINLINSIKLILNFNKEFNYENENENEDNEKEKEKKKVKLRKEENKKEKEENENENEENEK